jgi:hypothetical protein
MELFRRFRTILIGGGVVVVLIVVGFIVANPQGLLANFTGGGGGQVAVTGGNGQPVTAVPTGGSTAEPTLAPIQLPTGQVLPANGPIVLLNPATVKPGSSIGAVGTGFTPGSTITFTLKRNASDKGTDLGFVQADKGGSFGGFQFNVPADITSGTFIVIAQENNSNHVAQATGTVAANNPSIKLGVQVAKPGDSITFSATGFAPNETVSVYFNTLGGTPVMTFTVDGSGGVAQATIKVPFGAIGSNSFIFVGEKSQSPTTATFAMLSLYPTVTLTSYDAKADTPIGFNGKGFGPSEQVRVYLNSTSSIPIAIVQADANGAFTNAGAFLIPFELTGQNTIIAVGDQSQAAVAASFTVQPYTPDAQPSTYGGRPGTTISFYANGFAKNEVIRVYVGRTKDAAGRQISCFMTDGQGQARGEGSYTIPGDAQVGKLQFALVGDKTHAVATADVDVMDAGGAVNVPSQNQNYVCPYDATPTPEATPTTPAAPTSAATSTVPSGQTPSSGLTIETPSATPTAPVATPTSNSQAGGSIGQ